MEVLDELEALLVEECLEEEIASLVPLAVLAEKRLEQEIAELEAKARGGGSGPSVHHSELYRYVTVQSSCSLVLQGFLLHDINRMRWPADTSGGHR